ncbi:MAG: O-antigen ligase family protein [Cyanobacteria bacterium J06634_5]
MSEHLLNQRFLITTGIVALAMVVGLAAGFLTGFSPILMVAAFVAIAVVIGFFSSFETVILCLLLVRSSLDVLSDYQIPGLLALGIDALAILYVAAAILTQQPIETDNFWWFFLGWVALKGLWVVLLPLGGLGMDSALLSDSIREWIRLFSMVMVYLLVMQLKGKIPPQKLASILLLGLIVPLSAAALQVVVPLSMLPDILVWDPGDDFEIGARINGTLGHPATFSTFTLLFLGLTYWKLTQSVQKLPWLFLMGLLAFFLVASKSLTGLSMLVVFVFVLSVPRLNNASALIGAILLVGSVFVLFGSSEFGQERFSSLMNTPLLNRDLNWSRTILLSWRDGNSFNWRIAQWTFLVDAWREHPWLGNGIASSRYLTVFDALAHNDYIRALAEQGIVGLGLFLVFLWAQVLRLVKLMSAATRNGGQWTFCLFLLALLVAMMLGMLTDNILTHTTFFFYWWTLCAIAGWDWNEPPRPARAQLSSKYSVP